MSHEPSELQRRLEQATGVDCPGDELLDAETAALREGWVALGQLLDAERPADRLPIVLPRRARSSRLVKHWKVAAAVAVCLAVVTTAWVFLRPDTADRFGNGQIAASDTPKDPDDASTPPDEAPPEAAWAWDDGIDQDIVSLGEEVVSMQQDWDRLDDSFDPVLYGIEQIQEELDSSTL